MNFKSRIKTWYKGIVFRMSANNNCVFLSFYKYLYKPEKGSLDEFTSNFSKITGNVIVIQIGANDGINNDPIHKFIKRDHWKGVLLEPQKYVFKKFLEPLYMKTEGIIPLNAALDIKDGTKPVYKIAVSNSRWATGLTSFNREVLEDVVKSGYIEKQAKKEGFPLPADKKDYIAEENVECICTETLLKRYGITNPDWLQIDTEGFDFEIIKMFRIDLTKPKVIVYESHHFSSAEKRDCIEYLTGNGYRCADFGANTLAMREPVTQFEKYFNIN